MTNRAAALDDLSIGFNPDFGLSYSARLEAAVLAGLDISNVSTDKLSRDQIKALRRMQADMPARKVVAVSAPPTARKARAASLPKGLSCSCHQCRRGCESLCERDQ